MGTAEVRLERDGAVATLFLDDVAKKNALTESLGDRLQQQVRAIAADPTVRAVVLTGAGDAFSAGGDLAMLERLRSAPFDDAKAHMRSFYARYLSVAQLKVPTVAAVHGAAIGAGLCLAIACDVVVVADDAKLAFNFTALGLHPGMGATYFLPRRVGQMRAAELLCSGRRFLGDEAVRIGLALSSSPAAEVLASAQRLAASFAAQGPLAVRDVKRSLALVDDAALEVALAREAEAQASSYASQDFAEGMAAARERRAPLFRGV